MEKYIHLFLFLCAVLLFLDLILVQGLVIKNKKLKEEIEVLEYSNDLWERDYAEIVKELRLLKEELYKK